MTPRDPSVPAAKRPSPADLDRLLDASRAKSATAKLVLGLVVATLFAFALSVGVACGVAFGWMFGKGDTEAKRAENTRDAAIVGLLLGGASALVGATTCLLLMPAPRRRRGRTAPVTDARVLAIVGATAAAYGTHAPDEVCVARSSSLLLEDDLARVYHFVRRRLVLPASLLVPSPEGEAALRAWLAAAQAPLAITSRAAADLQARADFLLRSATREEETYDEDFIEHVEELWAAAMLIDWTGRLLVAPARWLLRGRLEAVSAQLEEAASPCVQRAIGDDAEAHRAHERAFSSYWTNAVAVSSGFGLFPSNVLAGFLGWQNGSAPREDEAPTDSPDELARWWLEGLHPMRRANMRLLPWEEIEDRALEARLRARGDDVARRLTVADAGSERVVHAFSALLDELAIGRPMDLARRLDDDLGFVGGRDGPARANGALFCGTIALLASAMLTRGGQLLPMRGSGGLSIRFEGERVDLGALVGAALASSEGARELAAWRPRIESPPPPRTYRPEPADRPVSALGRRGSEPRPASWHALRENGRARTKAAGWLLAGVVPGAALCIGLMEAIWLFGLVVLEMPLPDGVPGLVIVATVPCVLVPIALARPRRKPSRVPPIAGDVRAVLEALLAQYAKRHATFVPDEIVLFDALPGGTHALIEDRATRIIGGGVRIAAFRRDVLEERDRNILAAALDTAFAALAGTTHEDAARRRRAAALGANVGCVSLPVRAGEALDQGEGIARTIALTAADLPRRLLRTRLEKLERELAEATARYLEDTERALASLEASADDEELEERAEREEREEPEERDAVRTA